MAVFVCVYLYIIHVKPMMIKM